MQADVTLDCYGLLCPMPIIQTAKKIKEMIVGQVLEVVSTDEGIKEDMPACADRPAMSISDLRKRETCSKPMSGRPGIRG